MVLGHGTACVTQKGNSGLDIEGVVYVMDSKTVEKIMNAVMAHDAGRTHWSTVKVTLIMALQDLDVSELVEMCRLGCTLCQCPATALKYGFPVCAHHDVHGEGSDEVTCPECGHPE